jgi:hypothetical protein
MPADHNPLVIKTTITIADIEPLISPLKMRPREHTQFQRERLDAVLRGYSANLMMTHTDQAIQSLLNETEKMVEMLKGDDLRDAGLILSVSETRALRNCGLWHCRSSRGLPIWLAETTAAPFVGAILLAAKRAGSVALITSLFRVGLIVAVVLGAWLYVQQKLANAALSMIARQR